MQKWGSVRGLPQRVSGFLETQNIGFDLKEVPGSGGQRRNSKKRDLT